MSHPGEWRSVFTARKVTERLTYNSGDDEVVKIWNLQNFECIQTLSDQASQWGQITSLAFAPAVVGRNLYLMFGTGRGRLVIYQRNSMSPLFTQIFDQLIFTNFDCVESMTFSFSKQRILATSQAGKVKLFRFSQGQVSQLWERTFKDAIPRSSLFLDDGDTVQVYGLETGEAACFDTETAEKKGMRILNTRIGSASICHQTSDIIVDNMGPGFDLYAPNKCNPVKSFNVPAKRYFVKKAAFGEMGGMVVCGSDHGLAYVFGVEEPSIILQKILHGGAEERVPVVETGHSGSQYFIATASRGKANEICVWKKPALRTVKTRIACSSASRVNFSFLLNCILVIAFAWYTVDVWMPIITSHAQAVGTSMSGFVDQMTIAIEKQYPVRPRIGEVSSTWAEGRMFDESEGDDDWEDMEIDTL
ncbi:hypothetical protein CVT24_002470 [Panaeolus cyanescens]|uniref:Anaphase-promoting complex subunit 4 WD40 domain-containing protein n=1 Tax=Panaeolus cyanescens TaxID=181874 RepID=A0A409WVE6_9AGAR|nr:hypothetical protein CVT24_002470 [Panaeolus cyanescens]